MDPPSLVRCHTHSHRRALHIGSSLTLTLNAPSPTRPQAVWQQAHEQGRQRAGRCPEGHLCAGRPDVRVPRRGSN